MKVCKVCGTENQDNAKLCNYCGGFLGNPVWGTTLLLGLIIEVIGLFMENILILLGLALLIPSLFLFFMRSVQSAEIQKRNNVNFSELVEKKLKKSTNNDLMIFESFFIKTDKYRKKDGKVERGQCKIEFSKDGIFRIIQNDEIIENSINSIYYFNIWEYMEENYFKFVMKSHTEYMFRADYSEADKIAVLLEKQNIKIEDERDLCNEDDED